MYCKVLLYCTWKDFGVINAGDSWESPKAHLNQSQSSFGAKLMPAHFRIDQCVGISFAKVSLKASLEAAVSSNEFRTLLRMYVCLLNVNFNF